MATYPPIKVVTPKLHSRIRHDPYTIRPVSPHEPPPPLLPPHLAQRLPHGQLVRVASRALHLEQDLEALERRDDGARDSARHTAGAEGGGDGLGELVFCEDEGLVWAEGGFRWARRRLGWDISFASEV